VDDYVDAAFTAAVSGRAGPAVLMVPMDLASDARISVASANAELGARIRSIVLCRRPTRLCGRQKALLKARNPIVVAGAGSTCRTRAGLAELQDVAAPRP
jgi:acetolactate synthase-1/2/3 large subunit